MAFFCYLEWAHAVVSVFLFWNFVSYGGLYIVYYAYICETVPPIAIGIGFTFQYGCRTVLAEIWPIMFRNMTQGAIFALFSIIG